MSALKSKRRELIAAAASIGAAAFLPTPSVAQTGNSVAVALTKFTSREAGREHTDQLRRIRKTLGGKSPLSDDGLSQLLDPLVAMKLVTQEEAVSLSRLFKDIVNAGNVDALTNKINDAFKSLTDKVGDITQAIVRIASSSVQSAKEVVTGIDIKTTIFVVCNDISGCLTGAAAGFTLGGSPGVLTGAVLGSVSTSAIAVFGPKR